MEKKQKIALVLNIVVFLMAVAGSILCFCEVYIVYTKPIEHGIGFLKFFTLQSNIFAGITAFLYIIYLIREQKTQKRIPFAVRIVRYIATIDLILTFLVVALFLGFLVEEGYFSLYVNCNFFFHFAIPVISTISFIFFEEMPKLKIKHTFIALIHVFLYSIFYLVVVLTHFKDGAVDLVYDWYAFAQRGLIIAFVCAVIIFGVSYLTSFILYKVNNKRSIDK
ncbi:MAG: hypothetical protein K6F08_03340 [bacterium]|nr:hypothetical protein [bacterium]